MVEKTNTAQRGKRIVLKTGIKLLDMYSLGSSLILVYCSLLTKQAFLELLI
jgi:hypothetical protein